MIERWWIEAGQQDSLPGPLRVAAWMQPAPSRTVLSSDRQSAAMLFQGTKPLLVKWRCPIPSRARRTFLRASRERLEARAALCLDALRISTPPPLAVGELRHLGTLIGSVLIRIFDPDARTAHELAEAQPGVIAASATALAGWHERGFRHGDCYPKNMLFAADLTTPRPIGYPKARFVQPGPRLDRARLKDLAQFAAGCAELEPEAEPATFLASYALTGGTPPAPHSLWKRVLPHFDRVMSRKQARIASRPTREPDGPPLPTPLPPGFAQHLPSRVAPLAAL